MRDLMIPYGKRKYTHMQELIAFFPFLRYTTNKLAVLFSTPLPSFSLSIKHLKIYLFPKVDGMCLLKRYFCINLSLSIFGGPGSVSPAIWL